MSCITVFQLFNGLNKHNHANQLFAAVAFVGVLVLFFQIIIGCAPSLTQRNGVVDERIDFDFNRPVDASAVHPVFIPPHDIGEDCNHNRVNDTYDRAGLFPRGPYPVFCTPTVIAAGKLNNDDLLDLAVAGYSLTGTSRISVTILYQNGFRDFEVIETIDLGYPEEAISIEISDADGDGDNDILVPSTFSVDGAADRDAIILLRNDGEGRAFAQNEINISDNPALNRVPRHVIAADLDGGGEDVLAASGNIGTETTEAPQGNQMITLFSNGDFDNPQHRFLPTKRPYAMTVADFNDDSNIDLAVITDDDDYPKMVCVLSAGTDTDFANWDRQCFCLRITAQAIDTGDLNGDDDIDIAAVGIEGVEIFESRLNLYPYIPATSVNLLEEPAFFEIPGAKAFSIADVDGDGDKDIVLPVSEDNVLTIMVNTGGRFADSASHLINLPVQDGPRAIVAGDLDRDGRLEFVVANENSNDLWVIHRRPSPILGITDCRPTDSSGSGLSP
jgi:hypothetical protein